MKQCCITAWVVVIFVLVSGKFGVCGGFSDHRKEAGLCRTLDGFNIWVTGTETFRAARSRDFVCSTKSDIHEHCRFVFAIQEIPSVFRAPTVIFHNGS